MKRSHTIAGVLTAGGIVVAASAVAQRSSEPAAGPSCAYLHSYSLPSSGLALEGYCPVAYFAVDKAVRGKPGHATTHNGVTYWFVSADAKKAFDADPEKYLPAFGGWCAFGMSIQDKFPVDPTNFEIVDGRLMVFLKNKNIDARALWNQGNEGELVSKAEAHWRKVSG